MSVDGSNGFTIWGGTRSDHLGAHVSGAGDINGDGIADLIISALDASEIGEYKSGGALVVFGTATGFPETIDMLFTPESSPLDGTNGFAIVSAERLDGFGSSVSGVGDVNGDGSALYGDADGDGIVTRLDFAAFRRAFGSYFGDVNFSAGMDQEGDGAIGLLDFAGFRQTFGHAR